MNDSLILYFIDQGKNHICAREAQIPNSLAFCDLPQERAEWVDKWNSNPNLYGKPEYPAIWDLVTVDHIVETPMHLAMGCQKAVMRSTILFCSARNRKEEFGKRSRVLLQSLKTLRLDILPILTFKDEKFGGYVAENYSALTMICVWLSRVLGEDRMRTGEPDIVPDPDKKPIQDWTGKDCKAWLKVRGLKHSMSAPEAQDIVYSYLSGDRENIPPLVNNYSRTMDPNRVRVLLKSANTLFGTIMAQDLTGIQAMNRSEALVCFFLSIYEGLDIELMANRNKPIWNEEYNMLGMLRVPHHYIEFNLLRNLYEGGEQGEAVVKKLRQLCPSGVRDGWTRNMLEKYYRHRAMRFLKEESRVAVTDQDLSSPESQAAMRKFRRFKSLEQLKKDLKDSKPISVIACLDIVESSFAFVCVINRDKLHWSLHKLVIGSTTNLEDPYGFTYYKIEVQETSQTVSKCLRPSISGFEFHAYGVMLADHWSHVAEGETYRRYTIVAEDWEHFTTGNEWSHFV